MSEPHTVRYVVEGRGEFPRDMLRRDEASPATPADRALTERGPGHDGRDRYRVVLVSGYHGAPLTPRWESFGWRVVECSDSWRISEPLKRRPRVHPPGSGAAERLKASDAALEQDGGVRRTMRLGGATLAAMARIRAARGDRSDTALVERLVAEADAALGTDPSRAPEGM